jgi:BBSome-interacting protein 1
MGEVASPARMKAAVAIKEVLPKNGLVYSEKGAMSEMLCRPKILPIKSVEQTEMEKKQLDEAMAIDEEIEESKRESRGQ